MRRKNFYVYKSFVNLKFTCICAILARVNEEFERMRFSFEYFDKVWHRGLQFKLTQREIPSSIVKILSSYLVNRTGQIKFNGKIDPKFNIKSGVPQGGILSPTMYIFYTADMPRAGAGATDVMFADDVTQIVENLDNNREQLARDTEREINRINEFEKKKWKISTNTNKFKTNANI